jgi:CheY-like chemotaxis protein
VSPDYEPRALESGERIPGGQALGERGSSDAIHSLRNRLQKATLGLHLVQRMLESGKAGDVEPMLFRLFNELKSIEDNLGPAPEQPAPAADVPQPRRALIVDDDANESELLAGYLRLTGFEVRTAMDGMQAMVRLAEGKQPDIVLLDMQMPRLDGGKTVSAIRQDPSYRSLRIFAVTGSDSARKDVPIGPTGVNRWFTKPVNPQLLVEAINQDIAGGASRVDQESFCSA